MSIENCPKKRYNKAVTITKGILTYIIHDNFRFVQRQEGSNMHEFHIAIHSFPEVQDFIHAAMVQPFEIFVSDDNQQVNGKVYRLF